MSVHFSLSVRFSKGIREKSISTTVILSSKNLKLSSPNRILMTILLSFVVRMFFKPNIPSKLNRKIAFFGMNIQYIVLMSAMLIRSARNKIWIFHLFKFHLFHISFMNINKVIHMIQWKTPANCF